MKETLILAATVTVSVALGIMLADQVKKMLA